MKKKRFVALIRTAMRISVSQLFLIILFTCGTFAKNVGAQGVLNKEISIHITQGKIKQILKEIQNQTQVKFVYSPSAIKSERTTSVNFNNKRLGDILTETLDVLNITYRVVNNHILLYDKESPEGIKAIADIIIKGQVTSVKGESLPGVVVKIKGESKTVVTDGNGNYSLSASGTDVTLVFSYVGFTTKEVPAAGKNVVNIQLTEEDNSLGEIVVVGYSSQKKKDLTGAVTVVNVADMVKQPTANVGTLLQGQAPGVTVLGSGQPGEEPQIKIRGMNTLGSNSPLYIVDGVPTQNSTSFNPNDIETIQVLKDAASASIYGSRASNGVIIITTKKGKGQVNVQYDAYYGTQRPKTGNVWDILSPQEMADLKLIALKNSGATDFRSDLYGDAPKYTLPDYILPKGAKEGSPAVDPSKYFVKPFYTSDEEYNQFYRITKANKTGTNWYSEIFRPAPITSHNVNVSGGSDQGSYLFSANYFNQKGTLLETYLKRYTIRSNTQYNIKKWFRVGENLAYSITNNPQIGGLSGDNAIGHAFRQQPIVPVYDIMGNYAGSYGGSLGDAYNPVAMLRRTHNNAASDNRLFGNVFAEVDVLPSLTLRSSFGGDNYSGTGHSFVYPTYENSENSTINSYSENSFSGFEYTWTNTLSYSQTFGKHNLKVVAGTEFFKARSNDMSGINFGYFSFDPNYTNLTTGSGPKDVNSSRGASTLFSLIGRVDYSYNDRYLFGATIRRDGSSKFLQNIYGVFPAVSAGWRISQENFMKNVSWITDLKIRGGWGIMGNQFNVNSGNSFDTFSSGISNSYYAIGGGNKLVSGFFQNQIGNPAAKWEKDINSNIGFDATLFRGKLEITADYYQKNIKDMLFNPEMIGSAGAANVPYINIGQMKNTGFDIAVSGKTNIGKDFKINATASITTYHNEIQKLADDVTSFDLDQRRFDGNRIVRNAVGHSISEFFGYKVDGFWNTQAEVDAANAKARQSTNDPSVEYQNNIKVGHFKYKDVNGDGRITPEDRTFIGNPNPDFSYGLNLGVNYKDWDLSMFFYGVQGGDLWNQVKWWTDFSASFNGAKSKTALYDSWTPQHMNAKAPIQESSNSFGTNSVPNSYFVEDGSYLRLKNIQVGYTLPESTLKRFGVGRLRVYLSAANLFTITKYSGIDPEIGTSSAVGNQAAYGVDEGAYPSQRTFLLGLNLKF